MFFQQKVNINNDKSERETMRCCHVDAAGNINNILILMSDLAIRDNDW